MSAEELRERATTTRWEPPVYDLEEPLWTAEDPVTGCVGVGRVELEAFGNLVSAVHEYEADGGTTPYRKLPGRTVRRAESGPGFFDRLKERLGRR